MLEQKRDAKPTEKSHFDNFATSLREFLRVTGLTNLTASDLAMLDAESKDLESIYQRKKEQAGEIPASVLEAWGNIVSDSQCDVAERIFAWSFRLEVAAGLRWGDLLNTAPNTLVLLKSGLFWFAAKSKTRGKSEGRPCGASNFAFSNEKWLGDGYNLFKQNSGDPDRDFWI